MQLIQEIDQNIANMWEWICDILELFCLGVWLCPAWHEPVALLSALRGSSAPTINRLGHVICDYITQPVPGYDWMYNYSYDVFFSWLLRDKNMKLRTTYLGFTEAVDSFFHQLMKRVVPYTVCWFTPSLHVVVYISNLIDASHSHITQGDGPFHLGSDTTCWLYKKWNVKVLFNMIT